MNCFMQDKSFPSGHTEKIYFVHFHPLASDLIITASYDNTVRIWDLKQRKEVLQLEGHEDQVSHWLIG